MSGADFLANPALPRAIVVGVFGGVGLVLTAVYSRRGPMIYPVYACILAALAFVLGRFPTPDYASRFAAALAGFLVASSGLYAAAAFLGARGREKLVREGRLPESALKFRVSPLGHAWRIGFLLAIGSLVSAGVAFVAA